MSLFDLDVRQYAWVLETRMSQTVLFFIVLYSLFKSCLTLTPPAVKTRFSSIDHIKAVPLAD
jgi:hypothetical protein